MNFTERDEVAQRRRAARARVEAIRRDGVTLILDHACRLGVEYPNNALRDRWEATIAAQAVVLRGVLSRWPNPCSRCTYGVGCRAAYWTTDVFCPSCVAELVAEFDANCTWPPMPAGSDGDIS